MHTRRPSGLLGSRSKWAIILAALACTHPAARAMSAEDVVTVESLLRKMADTRWLAQAPAGGRAHGPVLQLRPRQPARGRQDDPPLRQWGPGTLPARRGGRRSRRNGSWPRPRALATCRGSGVRILTGSCGFTSTAVRLRPWPPRSRRSPTARSSRSWLPSATTPRAAATCISRSRSRSRSRSPRRRGTSISRWPSRPCPRGRRSRAIRPRCSSARSSRSSGRSDGSCNPPLPALDGKRGQAADRRHHRRRAGQGPGARGAARREVGRDRALVAGRQGEDLDDALARSLLTITFDGADTPQVAVPLGEFFGSGPGQNPFKTAIHQVGESGSMLSYWYMPFRKTAKISLKNQSSGSR